MSANNKNAIRKPLCKVCKDANKSVQEYSSHWTKDNKGNVCCPTLLNQKCRYCKESGHTTKYCILLESEKRQQISRVQYTTMAHTKKTTTQSILPKIVNNVNRFAELYELEEGEVLEKEKEKEKEPKQKPLPYLNNVTLRLHQMSFMDEYNSQEETPTQFLWSMSKPGRNWADDTSSDEEEE